MRAARFVRALAVGAAMSALVACERSENGERPNSFSSGNSQTVEQSSASADAGAPSAAVELTTSGGAPSAAVVAGGACSPVGAHGSELRPDGLVPCECVASAPTRAQWDCNERNMIVEGPLPPPEMALG